jgi:hypothetical protein
MLRALVYLLGCGALALAGPGLSPARAQPSIMPPAMFDACKGIAEGAPCQFTMGGHVIEGTCQAAPNSELACRPGPNSKKAKPKPAPQP